MVIVDTTVWIDFFNDTSTPETEWLDRELTQQRLGLLDLILCEVLQGVSTEEEAADVLRELRTFQIFDSTGIDLAIGAARNYRRYADKDRRYARRSTASSRRSVSTAGMPYFITSETSILSSSISG